MFRRRVEVLEIEWPIRVDKRVESLISQLQGRPATARDSRDVPKGTQCSDASLQ